MLVDNKIHSSHAEADSLILEDAIEVAEKHPVNGGGMADVYCGRLSRSTRKVALKVVRESQSGNHRTKECFHEALAAKHLTHESILPFLGISKTAFPGKISLISPFMENGNILEYLEDLLSRGRNIVLPRIMLLRQAADGLLYLRTCHFVHGDIKPPNILVDDFGHARLCDLGFAALSASQRISPHSNFGGTIRYMAPELFEEQAVPNYAADVYAFGMTIYEVVSGRIPFRQSSDPCVVLQVSKGARPGRYPALDMQHVILDGLWMVIESCWHQEPESRMKIDTVLRQLRILEEGQA